MNTNNTTMEEFFKVMTLKKQSPYYTCLQHVTKITTSQIQHYAKSNPQPTRGWVMWVNTLEPDKAIENSL